MVYKTVIKKNWNNVDWNLFEGNSAAEKKQDEQQLWEIIIECL